MSTLDLPTDPEAYAESSRPRFKKMRYVLPIAIAVIAIIPITSCAGPTEKADPSASTNNSSTTDTKKADDKKADEKDEKDADEEKMTSSQKNALEAAKNYLDFAPFSKAGLVRQLSSAAGDKYPLADAEWAVDHLEDVDWNEQAYKAAKGYLDLSPMSRDGLIQQLESAAGDKYTHEQAVYGADKALKE
jgi:host cell surface-exposed lipoprotein